MKRFSQKTIRFAAIAAALFAAATGCEYSQAAPMQQPLAQSAAPMAIYDLRYAKDWFAKPETKRAAWDEVHVIAALQGIVNRKGPRLYLRAVSNGQGGNILVDDWWLERLRAPGAWLEKRRLETVPNRDALLHRFRREIKGLVVYDEKVPATSNVASTVAGVSDLLPVRYDKTPGSLFNRLQEMGFPVRSWLIRRDGSPLFTGRGTIPGTREKSSGSAKNDAYRWAIRRFVDTGRVSDDSLALYIDCYPLNHPSLPYYTPDLWNYTLTNHDYFIGKRTFFFDLLPWADEKATDDPNQKLGTDRNTMKRILAGLVKLNGGKKMIHVAGFNPWGNKYVAEFGGKHNGVHTEWEKVRILTNYNGYLDADALGLNGMANASFFRYQPLPKYPKEKPLAFEKYLDADGRVLAKRYVSFFVGDWDSAAWMYQMLPLLWSDPKRGTVPLGWPFNPNLALRFPAGFWHTRKTRTPYDTFLAGDSGAGYVAASQLEAPRESGLPDATALWEAHNTYWYDRFGLSATGFILDGLAPPMSGKMEAAFARFSPSGAFVSRSEPGFRNGLMMIRHGGDLPGPSGEAADMIRARINLQAPTPTFHVFRSILRMPSWYGEVAQNLEAGNDIVVVEPYTLLELAKRNAQTQE